MSWTGICFEQHRQVQISISIEVGGRRRDGLMADQRGREFEAVPA